MNRQMKKIDDYVLIKKLGKGATCEVWHAQHIQTKEEFAIKIISKQKIDENKKIKHCMETEVSIMQDIDHPNILCLHDYFQTPNNYYLVTNYCNQVIFKQYLKSKNLTNLPESKAVYFLKQIRNAFMAFHQKNIMHRDVKFKNILFHNEVIIIANFGQSRAGIDTAQSIVGTYNTMAFKIVKNVYPPNPTSYSSKVDLWSIGVVFYDMLFGQKPFLQFNPILLVQEINDNVDSISFPFNVSQQSKDLIQKLLKKDPEERMECYEFFDHPLFSQFSQSGEENQKITQFIQNNFFTKNQQKLIDEVDEQSIIMYNIITHKQISKYVYERYDHEKNIIFFYVYSIQKVNKAFKEHRYKQMQEHLLFAILLLAKKAQTLTIWNIESIKEGKNIHKINQQHFNIAIKQDSENLLYIFKHLDQSMQRYMKLRLKKVQENSIEIPFLYIIKQSNPDLPKINQLMYSQLCVLRGYFWSQELENPELKHEYLLILLSLLYSIHSDKYFKYIENWSTQTKFNWKKFYADHEKKTVEEIQGELNDHTCLNQYNLFNLQHQQQQTLTNFVKLFQQF